MPITRRLFCASAAATAAHPLWAQPLTHIVVPFTAGGLTDILSRRIAQGLSSRINENVIVDNRPGAGGIPAIESMRNAAPDGRTLLMTYLSPHAANVSLYEKLPYDPVKDFTPISLVADSPLVLCVTTGMQAKTLGELIAHAKANPGKLNFASVGNGSPSHIALELFKIQAQVNIVHVPYRGTGPAMTDVLANHVDGIFDGVGSMPAVEAGKLRPIAIASKERHPRAPDVPTFRELGVDLVFGSWFGFLVPKGTPDAVVDQLNADLRAAVADPTTRAAIDQTSLQVEAGTPKSFADFLDYESKRLKQLVDSGVNLGIQ